MIKVERTRWYEEVWQGNTIRQVYHTSDPNLFFSGYARLVDVVDNWQQVEAILALQPGACIELPSATFRRIQ